MPEQRFGTQSTSASLSAAIRAVSGAHSGGGTFYRNNQGYDLSASFASGGGSPGGGVPDGLSSGVEWTPGQPFTIANGATERFTFNDDTDCHVEGTLAIIRNGKQFVTWFSIASDGTTPALGQGAGAALPGPLPGVKIAVSTEMHSGSLVLKLVSSGTDGLATVHIDFKLREW